MSLLKGDYIYFLDAESEPSHVFNLPDLGKVALNRSNAEIAIFPAIPGSHEDYLQHTVYRANDRKIHEIIDDEVCETLARDNYLRSWYPSWSVYTAILNKKTGQDNLESLNSPLIWLPTNQIPRVTYGLQYLNGRLVEYEDDLMPAHIDKLEPNHPPATIKRFLTADYKQVAKDMLEESYMLTVVPKGLVLSGVSDWLESIVRFDINDHAELQKLLRAP